MDQERIAVLLAKVMAGEATFQEQKELELAFREDPSLRETWKVMGELKEGPAAGMSTAEEQALLEKGLKRLDFTRRDERELSSVHGSGDGPVTVVRGLEKAAVVRSMSFLRWMMAVAAVLVLITTGVFLYSGNKTGDKKSPLSVLPAPVMEKELVSKYGSRSFIELSDGSKLWLNAGSKVQYPSVFAGDKREINLSGEAFFDVTHDPDHPFVIHTGKVDVRVLGTMLNVKAYPGDSLTETTLIKGKVEVDFTNKSHSSIVLKPSEKLIVSTGTGEPVQGSSTQTASVKEPITPKFFTAPVIADSSDGTIEETSWVENKLVFRKEPFAQLVLKLERWYNVKILFDNDKYRMDELTGTFKDQRIDEVMHALQLTSDFHYKISGDTIHIW
jgi:ferric-dicitrate binding protein FerR (iron transport regulator)